MPWFRVEDNFHGHPKVRAAGNAAIGLWVRCATYSAQYLLDGHIPVEVAHDYGKPREIDALITSTLWLPNGTGFEMHDFHDYNPTAADVRQHRAETSASKRAGGVARAQRAQRDEHGHFL
jgi:hypothetical protein